MIPRAIPPNTLAAMWQVSRQTICRLITKGELGSIRVGGQVRVPVSEVERYERENRGA
jgi:excisionase family DNA binding protein